MNKFSEDGMSRAKRSQKPGVLRPTVAVMNAKEKFLKEMKCYSGEQTNLNKVKQLHH